MVEEDVTYICVFEHGARDGKHVLKVTGERNAEKVRKHIQQIHHSLKILEFRPSTIEEIEKVSNKVKEDPNYVPMTSADLPAQAPEKDEFTTDNLI